MDRLNVDIDLKDFFRYFLKKRLLIVSFVIIFSILGNCFFVYKEYKAAKAIVNSNQSNSIETIKSKLTSVEIEAVEETYKTYCAYEEQYKAESNYYDSSLRMKLDANEIPCVELEYFIKDNTNKEMAMDAVSFLKTNFVNDRLQDELANQFEIDKKFVNELFIFDNGKEQQYGEKNSSYVSIRVLTKNFEECEDVAKNISKRVQEIREELHVLGDFDIIEIGQKKKIISDSTLLKEQQSLISNIKELKDSMKSMDSMYAYDMQSYYMTLRAQNSESNQETLNEVSSTKIDLLSKKGIILGTVGGIFIVCLYVFAIYVWGGKVHTPDDLKRLFGIGVIGDTVNSKVVDKAGIERISSEINIDVQEKKLNNILFAGEVSDCEKESIIQAIKQNIKCNVSIISEVPFSKMNSSNLETLMESNAVVLVEKKHCSCISDAEQIVSFCKKHDIEIIGAIVIE